VAGGSWLAREPLATLQKVFGHFLSELDSGNGRFSMRIIGCLLATSILLGVCLQTALSQEPSANQAKSKRQPTRSFTVACKVKGFLVNNTLTVPTITVRDGDKGAVTDMGRTPIVIGEKSDKADKLPKLTAIEGSVVEATVYGTGKKTAILDLSFETSCECGAGTAKKDQVRFETQKFRVVESVTLGKKTVAEFGDIGLEIVVNALPKHESQSQKSQQKPTKSFAAD
jgi:hypothetical protein